jgi:hypothetical protein
MIQSIKSFLSGLLIVAFFAQSCSREENPLSSYLKYFDPNYPTVLSPIDSTELQALQQEFDELNNYSIRTKLNAFGLPESRNYAIVHPNPAIKLTEDEAFQIAKTCILKNGKFINVADMDGITQNKAWYISQNSDSTAWGFRFGPQEFGEYEVAYSRVTVNLYADGVFYLTSTWFPDVYIPTAINYDKAAAKKVVIGDKIIWYAFDGSPNEFIVSESSITKPVIKSIYPVKVEDSIQMRATWKIPILHSSTIGWHIYVDVMSGEIVKIVQEFRT